MTFGGAGHGGSGAELPRRAPGATNNATIDFAALGNPYLSLNNVSTIVPDKPTTPVPEARWAPLTVGHSPTRV
jgi:hypothetical protein